MKIRVIQRWARNPETGERVDVNYEMQLADDEGNWHPVPVIDMEVPFEEDHDTGH